MKRRSKLLILVAVAAALCCLLVMMTSGADASGTCGAEGDNLTWTFNSTTGKLTINGAGDMAYYSSVQVPWYSYRISIKSVEIAEGVTSIGGYAFYGCSSLTSIEIPSSVTSIGDYAFDGCSNLERITILSRDAEIYDSSSTISSTATIYGYADSSAQTYAEKYDRKFIPLVVGDLNGDNILDSDDAVYLLWHTFMPDDYPIYSDCDFNQDDVVDSNDAIYLLWHTFMPDVYPIK